MAFQQSLPGRDLAPLGDVMVVRLTRKLAHAIDGIDISRYRVGEILTLQAAAARLLIAEGWAEMVERRRKPRFAT